MLIKNVTYSLFILARRRPVEDSSVFSHFGLVGFIVYLQRQGCNFCAPVELVDRNSFLALELTTRFRRSNSIEMREIRPKRQTCAAGVRVYKPKGLLRTPFICAIS